QLLAELRDQQAYEIEFENKMYQVEVEILENTEKYVHVLVAVDDGTLPAALLVLSASICTAQVPAKKTDLTVADREAWQKVLQWPVELEDQWRRSRTSNEPAQIGLVFHSLGQGNYLVQIEVQESSYQPRYLFMYYSELGKSPTRILKLKTYEGDDDDVNKITTKLVAEVEGIPSFDSAKKQLVFHTKGRGTG